MIARFADPERGGFFSTAVDGEQLITRRKDIEDTPIPSGSSSVAVGLLRLSELTGEVEYERHAMSALALLRELCNERGMAIVLATHDPQGAAFADQVHELRDGHLGEYRPEQVLVPRRVLARGK